MSESGPTMNGPSSPSGKYIDTIDPDDPEYQRQMMRPVEVKEDVREMENRRRVSLVLNSESFRKELEELVEETIKSGPHPSSLLALQQISDLLLPHAHLNNRRGGSKSAAPVIPVSDIHGSDSLNYCKGEKLLRCKLSSCYRLVDLFGWCQGIYNHISARINQEQEHFLINPFGLLYSEVTASSLVKIDMRGEVVDQGTTTLGINKAGFTLHAAIHQARPDIRCIIHLHTPEAVAVSVMKCGFLPMSQEALICGEVSYHDFNGILVDQEEKDVLQRNLGPNNKVMFLRNHGVVACGTSIEEAFHYATNVMIACESQVKAIPAGVDNIILVDSDIRKKTFMVGSQGGGGVDTGGKKWRTGELEFEALMRQLDNAGYRTGYVYRQPILKHEVKRDRANMDVEVPPSSSSFTYVFDGDYEHSKYMSPLKVALERQKQHYKAGWLNSPNSYIKQELEETGTSNPKKITKWVQDDNSNSPTRTAGQSMKLENPNQFAPQGSNPKEFKQKQKMIRKDYYEERVSAGPQSRVLEGMTWEEAQKLKDGNLSMTGDSVIVIGAASKGIIQRDQQHNVQVYKSQYQANPFESMTEDEIERYKIEVQGGGSTTVEPAEEQLEPGPEGKLISTEERIQNLQKTSQSSLNESKPEPEVPMSDPDDEVFRDMSPPVSPTQQKPVPASRKKRLSKETNIDDILDPYVKRQDQAKPPRRGSSRETLIDDVYTPDTSNHIAAPLTRGRSKETLIDDVYIPSQPEHIEPENTKVAVQRSESTRKPPKSPEIIQELKKSNFGRSKSERKPKKGKEPALNGEEVSSPAKSDTLKSGDSASGGETLERSGKEDSPTKEKKKKQKKFRMPSFGKNKNKESKESAI